MCSEGGSRALGPRPWNQGGRAQVPSRLRSSRPRIPQSSRLQSTVDEGAQETRRRVFGLPARKSLARENPMSGSGPSVSATSEGEQTVERVRNPEDGWCRAVNGPGDTDPSTEVAEGARNPRRGDPVRQDRGGHSSPNPERAAKPAGAAKRSSDRAAGRTAEHLVVVETTWRVRRTNVAATPDGTLREAAQP